MGRLGYVLTDLDGFTGDLGEVVQILAVTDGGFSFLGGVVGALLLCVPWIRREGRSTPRMPDAGARGGARAGLRVDGRSLSAFRRPHWVSAPRL